MVTPHALLLRIATSDMNRQFYTLFQSIFFLEDSKVFEFLARITFVLLKMGKMDDLEMEIDQLHLEVRQIF